MCPSDPDDDDDRDDLRNVGSIRTPDAADSPRRLHQNCSNSPGTDGVLIPSA